MPRLTSHNLTAASISCFVLSSPPSVVRPSTECVPDLFGVFRGPCSFREARGSENSCICYDICVSGDGRSVDGGSPYFLPPDLNQGWPQFRWADELSAQEPPWHATACMRQLELTVGENLEKQELCKVQMKNYAGTYWLCVEGSLPLANSSATRRHWSACALEQQPIAKKCVRNASEDFSLR